MKRILIVDDNRTNLAVVSSVLTGQYQVAEADSGAEALAYLADHSVDLILLDIIMPEMDGFEVMDRLRKMENGTDVPIIFLTADNDAKTETRCLEKGAVDFIAKPVVPSVVCSRIARTLELEDLRRSLAERLQQKTREATDFRSKSRQDPLTGLWNRVYTEESVDDILQNGNEGSLFMIDMDNFKEINDTYGHLAGDHTLKMFADTLTSYADNGDMVCRIGGDEFIVFFKGVTDKKELQRKAEEIIEDLCERIERLNMEINTSVSIGIAQSPGDGRDFKSLYNAADKALYHVKQNGKNSYHFYSEQREAENTRAGKLVDLSYLRDVMSRSDTKTGSYLLNYESFHHVYNFIKRCIERSNREIQTVLFTLLVDEGYTVELSDIENAMEQLEKAVFNSLRRSDVSTRYSSRQMVVILMDANPHNGDLVAKRIIDCFDALYMGSHIHVDYGIVQMDQ